MPEPLVSIVIPVYNQGRYLGRTIESVLGQDHRPLQCIVVDDGSTDDSHAVAEKYATRILLIRQANAGQAAALNAGFGRAEGEWVGYLSSDDTIDAGLVAQLVALARASPRAGPAVVFPRYRTIDEFDAVVDPCCPAFLGVDHMIEQFRCNIGPGALFSRTLLQGVSGWNPAYRQIPDYEFWLRIAHSAQFLQLTEVMASFRVHGGSQTFAPATPERADESLRLLRDMAGEAGKLPPGPSVARFRASAYVYSACLHLRSARFRLGLCRYADALRHSKATALDVAALRRVLRSFIAGAARWRS